MARHAQLAHRAARLQRLDVADRPMRVVTRRARHLALADWHVRDSTLGFCDLQTVTRHAHLRLRRLDKLALGRLETVHAVARTARQIAAIVRAAFPRGVFAAVVARET